jgi:uncharacterized protein YecE (DUF72 family)
MILVGTAGFSYQDWRGPFYPSDLSAKEMLGYYAGHFPFVELNTTYYRMPDPGFLGRLAQRTPSGFFFVVKAFQGVTHAPEELGPEGLRDTFARFNGEARILAAEGRLGAVLAQFPNSFRNTPPNLRYLARWREEFGELPVVVEFRHRSWLTPEVEQELKRNGLAFCGVDEPHLPGLLPPVAWGTAAPGYVRFHGRNAAKWWHHAEAYERYDYRYSEDELRGWLPSLLRLERDVGTVLVAMNNHYQGSAPLNAKMLAGLLDSSTSDSDRTGEQGAGQDLD